MSLVRIKVSETSSLSLIVNAANDGMVSSSRLPISHITPANVGTDEMLGSSRLMHTGGTPKGVRGSYRGLCYKHCTPTE